MRPLRPPPSLCVSMCACVITMMDGSEPGLLFRFIQGAGPATIAERGKGLRPASSGALGPRARVYRRKERRMMMMTGL